MQTDMLPTSPRLAALAQSLDAGEARALERFWTTITQKGTPLIEPSPTIPDHVLVTFLWRAHEPVEHVVLISPLGNGWWWKHFTESMLLRLQQTNLYYRTYDLRADARFLYQLSPNDALLHPADVTDWPTRTATWQLDPLNPRTYTPEGDPPWSVVELSQAAAQPWIVARPDLPAGDITEHHITSAIFGEDRRVWAYTPPGCTPLEAPYPLLLLFDGWYYTHYIPTVTILNNLAGTGTLAPMVALLLDTSAQRERDLTCSTQMCDFLLQELLPWAKQHYNVTHQAAQTIIGGASLGGLAAAFTGWRHAEVFGNVLSQSGSFWWMPQGDAEDEWLTRQIASSPTRPVRWYVETGLMERGVGPFPSGVCTNRHFRTVLEAKGYVVAYHEFNGGHEMLNWRGTLADGLCALSKPH
jgi:enterochelin esterase family protein